MREPEAQVTDTLKGPLAGSTLASFGRARPTVMVSVALIEASPFRHQGFGFVGGPSYGLGQHFAAAGAFNDLKRLDIHEGVMIWTENVKMRRIVLA
ncbi:hypothetical protein ASG60_21605 [Methylobacterium sp. Leaf469]|nr:hypothetical protein ASG60_21605 [Methylobacterium sp. Leaf469]